MTVRTLAAGAALIAAAAAVPAANAAQPAHLRRSWHPHAHVLPYSARRDLDYLRDVYGRLEVAHAGSYHGKPVVLVGEAREMCDDLSRSRPIPFSTYPPARHDGRIIERAAVRHLCPIW